MTEKTPRLRPHETQWGRSAGLTMGELRNVGDRMYHPPLSPDQQRLVGQLSIIEPDRDLAEVMEVIDNQPDEPTGGVGWPE